MCHTVWIQIRPEIISRWHLNDKFRNSHIRICGEYSLELPQAVPMSAHLEHIEYYYSGFIGPRKVMSDMRTHYLPLSFVTRGYF